MLSSMVYHLKTWGFHSLVLYQPVISTQIVGDSKNSFFKCLLVRKTRWSDLKVTQRGIMLKSHLLGVTMTINADSVAIIIATDLCGRISIPLPLKPNCCYGYHLLIMDSPPFVLLHIAMSELKSHVFGSALLNVDHIPVSSVQSWESGILASAWVGSM